MEKIRYTYWKGESGMLLGFLTSYPERVTQGENLEDLELSLKEIYQWIKEGVLEANKAVE